eukprot:gene17459-19206_t
MSFSKYDSSSPRGSRKDGRDMNSNYHDSSPESDVVSRRSERSARRSSVRDYFSDTLDEVEANLRRFEEESHTLMHDLMLMAASLSDIESGFNDFYMNMNNTIRNQHQSQSRRINDLLRNFEEARYRLDKINHRQYRGYDYGFDAGSERRTSLISMDRNERPGSSKDSYSKSKRNDDSASDRSDY